MRADADFMVFVAARWPALVKEAVRLGVPPDQAAEATADALSRCRRGWGRAAQEEDVGALVRAELVAAAGRRTRTPEAGREQAAEELLVLAPPTLDDLRHQERLRQRATARRAALVAVPLLLVAAGVGAYMATSGGHDHHPGKEDGLPDVAVSREENPAPGVVWYADGRLHLEHSVLAVEGLRQMTRVGAGVVYGDDQGRVVYAGDDGSRLLLGHTDPDANLAATDETGWAAWIETGTDHPALQVTEAATGNPLVTFPVEAGAEVLAVDGESVYFREGRSAYYRVTRAPDSVALVPADVLDVRARTRALQLDETHVQVVQPLFNAEITVRGEGADLAPDGAVVATQEPGSDTLALYDTRSGRRYRTEVAPGEHVVAFSLGRRLTLAVVVAPQGASPGHELELRTCELAQGNCMVDARIPNLGGTPVLAR